MAVERVPDGGAPKNPRRALKILVVYIVSNLTATLALDALGLPRAIFTVTIIILTIALACALVVVPGWKAWHGRARTGTER